MQLAKQFKDKFLIITYFRTVVCFFVLVLFWFFFFCLFLVSFMLVFNILRSMNLFENLMR